MIEKTCETCHPSSDAVTCGECERDPARPAWAPSRAALEAEVAHLRRCVEGMHEGLDRLHAEYQRCCAEWTREHTEVARLGEEVTEWREGFFRERNMLIDALNRAVSRSNEEHAARAGLEEQLAKAERLRDELRAQAAARDEEITAMRSRVARMDSECDAMKSAEWQWHRRFDSRAYGWALSLRRALLEANRRRRAERARAEASEARVRELEARPPLLPEVEPQFSEPAVGEEPP